MPRIVQITREKILTAALDILIRDGYSAVNIKSIAGELKCSTQPIAWQFGNMDNMREALTQEAVAYANRKMTHTSKDCVEAFWQIGYAYISLAFDTPNLFRFVYMGESGNYCRGGFNSILTDGGNAVLIDKLYQHLNISREQAEMLFQRVLVYTHGVAALVTAGVLNCTKEQACSQVKSFGFDMFSLLGIELNKGVNFDEKNFV
ncbi:MAG: TetR family transcriptional regulator [Oscillospiraceae bacterium]|jgi:AcrR family transcriptional regulator|nr:TetR family transcriptional regulator [Oscillospiraceae bacterium]